MERREFIRLAGGASAAAILSSREASGAASRPNIVMIMADDMGYSDLGCYGSELETPALNRLAARGLRFTHHHTENMCVPTRSSLMSGLYNTVALENHHISQRCATVAELLREAGYATYMSGKWHLARPNDRENLPCQRGFEQFFGTIIGAGSFYAPASLMRNNENAEEEFQQKDFYYTDAISDNAVRFIGDAARKDKPFFLYVAYTAAHWPLHAFPEDIARYQGKYAKGWDKLRLERHARMKELGVINPAWRLSPRHHAVPAWEAEPHQKWQQRRMEVYAAQVNRMDRGIARLVDALQRSGHIDNTLLVFQIDNGGCHVEYTPDRKGAHLPEKTRDGRPMRPGNLPDIMPGPEDTYQSYGHGWANASNTPFRLFKQYDHEGGIMTPLVVHWPKVITKGGQITEQVSHVIDLTPTFLDAAGVSHPRTFRGRQILPPDGTSLLPVFQGKQREPHEALYWKWAHGRAVRVGRWKLAAVDKNPWELYDLDADGTELVDLSKKMPERVRELDTLWKRWAARTPEQILSRST
jgi:arylsulfatase A-like enzyme